MSSSSDGDLADDLPDTEMEVDDRPLSQRKSEYYKEAAKARRQPIQNRPQQKRRQNEIATHEQTRNANTVTYILQDKSGKLNLLNPSKIRDNLKTKFNIMEGRRLPSGDYEVQVPVTHITEFGKIKAIQGHAVMTHRKIETGPKGIIKGIHPTYTEKQLLEEWKEQGITTVRFLNATKYRDAAPEVTRTLTRTALITGKTPTLPEYIYLGYQRIRIQDYQPNPIICYKCERYGHMAKTCRGKITCSHCGGEHNYKECTKLNRPAQCTNCNGQHTTRDRGCPAYKQATKTIQIMTQKKISYKEAQKQAKPTLTFDEQTYPKLPQRPNIPRIQDTTLQQASFRINKRDKEQPTDTIIIKVIQLLQELIPVLQKIELPQTTMDKLTQLITVIE